MYARDVTVRCCDDTGRFTYRFRCPDCRMWMVKDAQDDAVMLLLGVGARSERWHLPLELSEHPAVGPRSTTTTCSLFMRQSSGCRQRIRLEATDVQFR